MDDTKIIELFWSRSEKAISETDAKYGKYCFSIAYNILANEQDAEESVSDTYWAAWNQIPPKRPQWLSVFLGKITRNISINRYKTRTAHKRGSGEIALALEELEECVSGSCAGSGKKRTGSKNPLFSANIIRDEPHHISETILGFGIHPADCGGNVYFVAQS